MTSINLNETTTANKAQAAVQPARRQVRRRLARSTCPTPLHRQPAKAWYLLADLFDAS